MFYFVSILAALAFVTLLVVFASVNGVVWHIVGYSIYGAALLAFYLVRAVYAGAHESEKGFHAHLRRLDHVMIYILTAATYTPVALLLPQRAWAWTVFGVVWGLALVASVLRYFESLDERWVTLFLYGALIVLDITAYHVVHDFLSSAAVFWFGLGGLAYILETLVVVWRPSFLLNSFIKKHESVAFPLVMLGSFAHFWALFKHVLFL